MTAASTQICFVGDTVRGVLVELETVSIEILLRLRTVWGSIVDLGPLHRHRKTFLELLFGRRGGEGCSACFSYNIERWAIDQV